MSLTAPFVGIDFGTDNSLMAWFNPRTRQAEVLRNAEGEERTRTLVYFGKGEELVGTPAEHMLADEDAKALVYPPGAKRNIGKKMALALGDRMVTPLDVAVAVLRKLKRDAEELHFHAEADRAVITVPAVFDQIEKERVQEAGRLAGFREVELLEEPVAAALAYARDGPHAGRGALVYDLGAGTFDLALLTFEGDEGPSLALPPRGLRKGGNDFDLLLYRHIDQKAQEQGRSVSRNGAINLEVLRQCRERKENLSLRPEALFSSMLPDGRALRHKLDRQTFEALIAGVVAETVAQTEKMLQEAREHGHEIDTVLLVGGSSRIPLVAAMLQEKLPVKPLKWHHQDVAVALGAAYHAQALWGTAPVAPFQFRSGGLASGLADLIALCAQHREDAEHHLLSGHFEAWLRKAGHAELAARCQKARSSKNATAALLSFLRECGSSGEECARRIEASEREAAQRAAATAQGHCPKCGFSYGWDGSSCKHCGPRAERPPVEAVGSQPAAAQPPVAPPFRFRSGGEAIDLAGLLLLCGRHWEDASWHLKEGHFEPWLRGIGQEELARASEQARNTFSGPHHALVCFLRQCGLEGMRLVALHSEPDRPAGAAPSPQAPPAGPAASDPIGNGGCLGAMLLAVGGAILGAMLGGMGGFFGGAFLAALVGGRWGLESRGW